MFYVILYRTQAYAKKIDGVLELVLYQSNILINIFKYIIWNESNKHVQ